MVPDEPALAYLEQVLRLEPGRHAQAMLDLRAGHLGRSVPPRTPRAIVRAAAQAALASLRCDLWSLDARTFRGRAREIDVEMFPDLRRELGRLEQAIDHRDAIEKLAASPGIDPFLVDALRDLISLPHAVATARRDELLRVARGHRWRRRRALRRGERAVLRRVPDLALVEREFFERVRRLEAERMLCKDANRTGRRPFWWGLGSLFGKVLLIICLFAVAVAIVAVFLR